MFSFLWTPCNLLNRMSYQITFSIIAHRKLWPGLNMIITILNKGIWIEILLEFSSNLKARHRPSGEWGSGRGGSASNSVRDGPVWMSGSLMWDAGIDCALSPLGLSQRSGEPASHMQSASSPVTKKKGPYWPHWHSWQINPFHRDNAWRSKPDPSLRLLLW